MKGGLVPFDRYPGLPPLFLEFLRGAPDLYPDPPALEAAASRAAAKLGTPSRIPADAFRFRGPEAAAMAEDLARGRAVAVVAGHQVGLFTGPLFTLVKALDAIRLARELTARGSRAVPVFFALTDDHDLEEVAKTARPGPEGPEVLVLDGADRSNRRPVGAIPLPPRVTEVLESFRPDARAREAPEILERFGARYSPGRFYGEAFVETLLDLVRGEPLLVLDPCGEAARRAAEDFFRRAVQKEAVLREALREGAERVEKRGLGVPVPLRPGVFPFFLVEDGERRRVDDTFRALSRLATGAAWASADVLTRPPLKSFLMPVAASVLGPAEIAYHAQALPLFGALEITPPVLFPRSHVVLVGPAERRAAEALGISRSDLLAPSPSPEAAPRPETGELAGISERLARDLSALESRLTALEPTLAGAVENAGRKIRHQLDQLADRVEKAAARQDTTGKNRRARLETMLRPLGTTAERVYPPLVPLLAHGWPALDAIREAASGSLEGARIVDLGAAERESAGSLHGG